MTTHMDFEEMLLLGQKEKLGSLPLVREAMVEIMLLKHFPDWDSSRRQHQHEYVDWLDHNYRDKGYGWGSNGKPLFNHQRPDLVEKLEVLFPLAQELYDQHVIPQISQMIHKFEQTYNTPCTKLHLPHSITRPLPKEPKPDMSGWPMEERRKFHSASNKLFGRVVKTGNLYQAFSAPLFGRYMNFEPFTPLPNSFWEKVLDF